MERINKKPKHLTLKVISEKVQEFYKGNKRFDKIPVPIDDIVSKYYGYNVIPAPNLYGDVGVEGFVLPQKKEIYVDQEIHDNTSPNRYNSTLAHEVGHLALHREFLGKFKSEEEVVDFLSNFDPGSLDWLEKQAWTYARYLLLPSHAFNKKLEEMIKERNLADQPPDSISGLLKIPISNHFGVADIMAQIRIKMYLENGI